MSRKDKWVRRFSVDETARHKNGFTIYKITSVLFPIESPEAMTVVSVWKRFSDVQRLHKRMRALHAGLHLKGACPDLPKRRYFARFQKEVIEERCKCIKMLLEFIADHKLLFTSTDFVNFLQSGHEAPECPSPVNVISSIRASLDLPDSRTPPLEYRSDDDDTVSRMGQSQSDTSTINDTTISQIPVYRAADIEIRPPKPIKQADSFESISSIESTDDFYQNLDKITIDTTIRPKQNVLPDLINFDVPSTSRFDDYHTHKDSETVSISTTDSIDWTRSSKSTLSMYKSTASLSNVECKTKTEDSYVFEAGHILNLAARCEDIKEYQKAFDYYKVGIEKMLLGVQTDTDPQRRALIKKKTNKYLSYAENVYKKHLCGERPRSQPQTPATSPPPRSLCSVRTLSAKRTLLLVLHQGEHTTRAMKIIQKIPNNLTDEYFLHDTKDTRHPVLPSTIPYMVQLHSFIETNDLIFLLLTHAPGGKLFDYIHNYTKSIPNTPSREVNLENVFTEPINKLDCDNNIDDIEIKNLNLYVDLDVDELDCKIEENISIIDRLEANIGNNNKTEEICDEIVLGEDVSVNDLVKNSQRLMKNVDRVLSDVRSGDVKKTETVEETNKVVFERKVEMPAPIVNVSSCRGLLPPATVCRWGAQILTAIEYLHKAGVVLIDLNPTNILLGDRGQVILTYFVYYPGEDMCLAKLRARERETDRHTDDLYIAPELYMLQYNDGECDFWSFGVVMYELLCGLPLSHYHRSRFTSHTILQMPDGLPIEQQSLLTQLLTYDPSERLGGGKDGIEEIKRHPYFKQIDWQEILDSWVVPD